MTTLLLSALVLLQPLQMSTGFVRTIDRTDGIAVSQTASRRLSAPGKPDIWLVGVAHIGLKQYYSDIQSLLDGQDVVLFEGVRPRDGSGKPSKVDPKAPKQVYQTIGDFLGLDFQLADINYDHDNWLNSDLTLDELDKLNKKTSNGKPSQFDTIKQMLSPGSEQSKMLGTFFKTASPGVKEALKIFLVDKLAKVDTVLASFADPATINILLTARNQSISRTLDAELAKPNPPKSIAIFYGAAHQSDVKKTIVAKYGYHEVEQRWFTFATADRHKLDDAGRQFLKMFSTAKLF